jgi:glycerol-3-phosphate O-acyltransferase
VLDRLPPDSSPVYLINHRSNVDFVLLSYILAGKVSVSYAVGEWARVWPLEHLFKSFGSYLIRRGYKEDLYHTVLRRYVQMSTRHGVAQAFFPEGRLTRDGALLEPKLGLLNWYTGVEAEPGGHGRVVFIPVGVNYDWVLEDENLVREAEGRRQEKKGLAKKIGVILIGPFVFFGLLIVNGARRLTGRLKLHGYASLSFGEPLVVSDYMAQRGVPFHELSHEERKAHIGDLGTELMRRLGQAVPATPATILAMALLDHDCRSFTRMEASVWVADVQRALREAGAPIVHGQTFAEIRSALGRQEAEPAMAAELQGVERGLEQQEEAEQVVRYALDVLRRNKILRTRADAYELVPGAENRLRYYANSIAHHVGRVYPFTPEEPGEAPRPVDG